MMYKNDAICVLKVGYYLICAINLRARSLVNKPEVLIIIVSNPWRPCGNNCQVTESFLLDLENKGLSNSDFPEYILLNILTFIYVYMFIYS